MPKKRIIKSNDDTVLWQRVITTVKPLKSTIESTEFATIFAQSDHLAPPVAKLSGSMQRLPVKPLRPPIAATSSTPAGVDDVAAIGGRSGLTGSLCMLPDNFATGGAK